MLLLVLLASSSALKLCGLDGPAVRRGASSSTNLQGLQNRRAFLPPGFWERPGPELVVLLG